MNETLLLLPGMMCDARLFAPQVAEFSVDRQVMVMPLTGRITIKEIAEDILLKAPNQFALLGLSMGGIVAMEMIRQAPERVTRLALLDTNPMADTPERVAIREQQIDDVRAGKLHSVIRDEMKPNYLADGQNKAAILELCMSMAEALGPKVFIQQSKALQARRDQCDTLKNVRVPTLIACGEHDSLCPLEKHQLMHRLVPDSKLSVIAGAGHLPTLERAALINHELGLWLQPSQKHR